MKICNKLLIYKTSINSLLKNHNLCTKHYLFWQIMFWNILYYAAFIYFLLLFCFLLLCEITVISIFRIFAVACLQKNEIKIILKFEWCRPSCLFIQGSYKLCGGIRYVFRLISTTVVVSYNTYTVHMLYTLIW